MTEKDSEDIRNAWKDYRNEEGKMWFASEKCADNIREKVFIWPPEEPLNTMMEYTRAIYGLEMASRIIREVESNPEVSDERSRELLVGIEDKIGALWIHLLAEKHEVRKKFWEGKE